MLRHMVGYGETDLLCYRSPSPGRVAPTLSLVEGEGRVAQAVRGEGGLQARQDVLFDPILQWANEAYKLDFRITDGIAPIEQPKESLAKLRKVFEQASDKELAALSFLVPLLGSALLTLALWKGQITVEQAIAAAHLDEDFQAEQWGKDEEAEVAWAKKQQDIHEAAKALAG